MLRSPAESAEKQGVARPFAILSRMPAGVRREIASILGIYFRRPDEGPERESWDIINRDLRGLQARTHRLPETISPFSRNNNWWEIVTRTARRLRIRFDPGLPDRGVERLIFERVAAAVVDRLQPETLAALDRLIEGCPGLMRALASVPLSPDGVRLVMAGIVASTAAPAETLAQRLNRRLGAELWIPTVSRGLTFLLERLEQIVRGWRELPAFDRLRARPVATVLAALYLHDAVLESLERFEAAGC
jgi:hypothetical protein